MAKTSLILETTDTSGKKIQKTFTDVNPEASSADLVTFAQMCNGLTSNTYVRTDRVNKINCDTETSGGDSRAEATVTFPEAVDGVISVSNNATTNRQINYNGSRLTKEVFDTFDTHSIGFDSDNVGIAIGNQTESGYTNLLVYATVSQLGRYTVPIKLGGTDTHKPVELNLVLNVTN